MKNYKQILEAVNRGIKLALDDYEDQQISIQKTGQIIDSTHTKELLEWNRLIKKFDEGRELLSKSELKRVAYLSKLLNAKYDNKYEGYYRNNRVFLQDAIDNICQVDPSADLNWLDVSEIKDMSQLFAQGNCKNFCGDISEWDVSKVEYMSEMFMGAENFNGNISKWKVSNVKNMKFMFYGAIKFNNDISGWDTSNVWNMSYMFAGATSFNRDLSHWNVEKVTNSNCFAGINKTYMNPEYIPKFIEIF